MHLVHFLVCLGKKKALHALQCMVLRWACIPMAPKLAPRTNMNLVMIFTDLFMLFFADTCSLPLLPSIFAMVLRCSQCTIPAPSPPLRRLLPRVRLPSARLIFSTVVKPSEKLGWEYLGTFQICLNSLQTMIETMEMYSFRTDWSWPIEDSTTRTQATSWSKTWGMPRHEVPRREIGYFIRHRTVSYTQRHSFFAFSFLVTMFSDLF